MTRLQGLYATADGLGLQICYFPMGQLTAISTPDGFIGMDVDKLENTAEETVCLAHEMGHCLTGSFYTVESSLCQRRRCEERAAGAAGGAEKAFGERRDPPGRAGRVFWCTRTIFAEVRAVL